MQDAALGDGRRANKYERHRKASKPWLTIGFLQFVVGCLVILASVMPHLPGRTRSFGIRYRRPRLRAARRGCCRADQQVKSTPCRELGPLLVLPGLLRFLKEKIKRFLRYAHRQTLVRT